MTLSQQKEFNCNLVLNQQLNLINQIFFDKLLQMEHRERYKTHKTHKLNHLSPYFLIQSYRLQTWDPHLKDKTLQEMRLLLTILTLTSFVKFLVILEADSNSNSLEGMIFDIIYWDVDHN